MVWAVVVMVTAAFAGGVTVFGLTAQVGGEVVVCVDETWQVRSTVPLKPLTVPTVTLEEEVPPGATAAGENADACKVKSWAEAKESIVKSATVRHKQRNKAFWTGIFTSDKLALDNLDFVGSEFNMSRFK